MAALTRTSLVDATLSLLAESRETDMGALYASPGGAEAVSWQDGITRAINDASAHLARTAVPIAARASIVAFAAPEARAADAAPLAGAGPLWAVTGVHFNSLPLAEMEAADFDIHFGTQLVRGDPRYWCDRGSGTVSLSALALSPRTLLLIGLALPPALSLPDAEPTGTTTTLTGIDEDVAWRLVPVGAALKLAGSKLLDAQMPPFFAALKAEWDVERARLRAAIPEPIRLRHYPQAATTAARTSAGGR
jgi:hypothetical protein